MAETVTSYLKEKPCAGRKQKPVYFEDGDFVTFYFADDEAYEDRADALVTLYRSFETGNLVGCKIKGVKRILSKFGDFGVVIHDHGAQLTLGMLFLGAALANPERRDEYERLGKQYGKLPVESGFPQAA